MKNQTGKYFKYAIGEIVLVVIGILIALAISNWNSNRIQNNKNKELLIKLSKEIDQNIERTLVLDTIENGFKNRYKSTDSVIKILNKGITVEDLGFITSQKNYYTITINFNTIAFEELKNTGSLYALGSDSIVSAIQNYYKLCERESFYNYEIGQSVISLQEKCYDGYFRFRDFFLQDPNKAIAYHNWIFDPQSQNYVSYKQYVNRNKVHSNMMVNKMAGILEASKKLNKLINEEINKQ